MILYVYDLHTILPLATGQVCRPCPMRRSAAALSDALRNLLRRMLEKMPRKRPGAVQRVGKSMDLMLI